MTEAPAHIPTRVWANNISDEPEAIGQRDFFVCPCGWSSDRVSDGGERQARDHERENCSFCQQHGTDGPPHFASSRCESGRRNHCSCDTCF